MCEIDTSNTELPPLKINDVNITHFFKDRHVFVTGGTGFMGKVLLEKLLRSCGALGNLYILLRPKKGVNPEDRLKKLLQSPVFERLKDEFPSVLSKIIPIEGDVSAVGLGLSESDRALLQGQVSVVFHVASVVSFGQSLKKSVLMNVRGTQEIMELARGMKNVKAVVYVSTAYSNTDKARIAERVCWSSDWRTLVLAAERMDSNQLDVLTSKIIDHHENTYTFTKFLAESVVYDYRKEVPVIIFRPSIVCFAIREPMAGWIDSLNGPAGLYLGLITGVLRVAFCDKNVASDFMPVDVAINSLITAAWYRGLAEEQDCIALNCASGKIKHVTYEFTTNIVQSQMYSTPPQRVLWHPGLTMTTSYVIYYALLYIMHVLPALIVDTILKLKGVQFSLLRLYRKIHISNMVMSNFSTRHWDIQTNLFRSLQELMHDKDRNTFGFDVSKEDEVQVIKNGTIGLKKYILKETMNDELDTQARRNMLMYYWLDRSLKALFLMWFALIVINRLGNIHIEQFY